MMSRAIVPGTHIRSTSTQFSTKDHFVLPEVVVAWHVWLVYE